MKSFVLDCNSWHFRLANFGNRRIWSDEETDICEYTRAVMSGTFLLFGAALGTMLGILWVGASFYNIYTFFAEDAKIEAWTLILLMFSGGILLASGIILFREWWKSRPVKDGPEKEPGFIKLAYRKVKDKTCARIEFKND